MKNDYKMSPAEHSVLTEEDENRIRYAEKIFGRDMTVLEEKENLLNQAIRYWTDLEESDMPLPVMQSNEGGQPRKRFEIHMSMALKLRIILTVIGSLSFLIGSIWSVMPGVPYSSRVGAVILFMFGSGLAIMQWPVLFRNDSNIWEAEEETDSQMGTAEEAENPDDQDDAGIKSWEPEILLLLNRAGLAYGQEDCLENLCELYDVLQNYRKLYKKEEIVKRKVMKQ